MLLALSNAGFLRGRLVDRCDGNSGVLVCGNARVIPCLRGQSGPRRNRRRLCARAIRILGRTAGHRHLRAGFAGRDCAGAMVASMVATCGNCLCVGPASTGDLHWWLSQHLADTDISSDGCVCVATEKTGRDYRSLVRGDFCRRIRADSEDKRTGDVWDFGFAGTSDGFQRHRPQEPADVYEVKAAITQLPSYQMMAVPLPSSFKADV